MSHEGVSGFPEKGADLRGSPGTSGEVWGTSGEVRETSGEPLDCCSVPQWENFRWSPRKTSGKFGELPGGPGTSQKLGGAWLPPSDSPNLSPRSLKHDLHFHGSRQNPSRCWLGRGGGFNPVLPFLVFLEKGKENHRKTRIFYSHRTPKIPGK